VKKPNPWFISGVISLKWYSAARSALHSVADGEKDEPCVDGTYRRIRFGRALKYSLLRHCVPWLTSAHGAPQPHAWGFLLPYCTSISKVCAHFPLSFLLCASNHSLHSELESLISH